MRGVVASQIRCRKKADNRKRFAALRGGQLRVSIKSELRSSVRYNFRKIENLPL
jgi:hypothetical protein